LKPSTTGEQELLDAAAGVRDHQVNQLQVRRHGHDMGTIRAQAVLTAFAPIHQDIEAPLVLPQRDQRIIGVGATAERNHGVRKPA
jgi:hypothetical protein